MRLKYYLRGLGVGMIVTAVVFLIASSGKKETLSDKEIMERAEALGMVMAEEPGGLQVKPDDEGAEVQPETEPGGEAGGDTADGGTGGDTAMQPDGGATDGGTAMQPGGGVTDGGTAMQPGGGVTDGGTAGQPGGDVTGGGEAGLPQEIPVTIEVAPGDVSRAVSEKLKSAGLITDAEDFNRYLDEANLDSELAVGVHQIPQGATYEQIGAILTQESE